MNEMTLGKQIKNQRERVGLSQIDLTHKMGFKSLTTIYQWENDKRTPTLQHLLMLNELFGFKFQTDKIKIG